MASYAASERALAVALHDLHDVVWAGARRDEAELLLQLERGARALDRHLGTRGRIERGVRPMTRSFLKASQGPDLFTFLHAASGLAYAADRVRRQPREAAKAASELAVSPSIRLASAAGAAGLADRFESGRTDFGEFSAQLVETLEERGVLRAREFGHAANLAFDVHALWNRKLPAGKKRILATTSVSAAGFACIVFVDALRSLGRYRETPYGRLVPVVAAILEGLGGHP